MLIVKQLYFRYPQQLQPYERPFVGYPARFSFDKEGIPNQQVSLMTGEVKGPLAQNPITTLPDTLSSKLLIIKRIVSHFYIRLHPGVCLELLKFNRLGLSSATRGGSQ